MLALQKEWYEKLKKDGFRDIERNVDGKILLSQVASKAYECRTRAMSEDLETYFRLLSQQVHEAQFRNTVDQWILTWYADGWRIKCICDELARKGHSRARHTVRFIIRRYEMLWGMRTYTAKQLNRRTQ